MQALRSLEYADVFAFHAQILLDELSQRDTEVAHDIERIVKQALKNKKLFDITTSEGVLDEASYNQAYAEAMSQEEVLTKLSENMYRKYQSASAAKRTLLIAAYAKLTNMLVSNKLLTRENVLDVVRGKRDRMAPLGEIPIEVEAAGFLERMLWPMPERRNGGLTRNQRVLVFDKIDAAIDGINSVVFEPVLTAHPTIVDNLTAIVRLREVNDVGRELTSHADDFAQNNIAKLRKAMGAWLREKLTPEDEKGMPRSFTPFEEMEHETDALTQIFHNMPGVRQTFDGAFLRRANHRHDIEDTYTPEMRLRLAFNLRPKSWVMGDKDGNDNIKAEHLLYSLVNRRLRLLQLYQQELRQLEGAGIQLPQGRFGPWQHVFASAEKVLKDAKQRLDDARGAIDLPLSQTQFDDISALAGSALPMDFGTVAADFVKSLEQSFLLSPRHAQDRLINLIDQARIFQMNMGALELRETSEEYTKVIGFLIDYGVPTVDYRNLDEKQRIAVLEAVLAKPCLMIGKAQSFLDTVDDASIRHYGTDEAITYHTLQRLRLAAQNPDAIKDMILAEFEQSSNILEALLLQKLAEGLTGKPLALPVSPLFEKLDTLENSSRAIMAALQTKAYRTHLLDQAGGDVSKLRIKIQAAHSDNVRRSGSPAGRAGIYGIHRDLPEFLGEHSADIAKLFAIDGIKTEGLHIKVEWFEGKSSTDTSRGGGRAQSAMVNAYGLHDHTKETFQGFDIYYFLSFKEAFKRMTARLFSHNAKELAIQKREQKPDSVQRFAAIEDAVVAALKKTFPDYAEGHFKENVGGLFRFPLWDAELKKILANRGSRNAARGAAIKPRIYNPKEDTRIATDTMRSIPYGNNLADAEMHVAMLGTQNIERYLTDVFVPGSKAYRELSYEAERLYGDAPIIEGGSITIVGLQTLYRVSPAFRDAIDFIGNGLLQTNLKRQSQRFEKANDNGIQCSPDMVIYTGDILPREYGAGAKLVLASFGHDLPGGLKMRVTSGERLSIEECSRLRFLLENLAFWPLQEETKLNDALSVPLRIMNDGIIMRAWREGRRHFTKFRKNEWRDLSNITSATLA
ncbi:MAG: phosphoenolpyruvate carboxylase, partial [Alphaproteobacteria bacterium]